MAFPKKLLSFLLSIILIINSLSAADVKGRLTDEANTPLAFANILVEGRKGTSSDLDGYFLLKDLEQGTYTMRISYLGYETLEITLEISQSEATLDKGKITLKRKAILIDEFTVNFPRSGFSRQFEGSNSLIETADLRKIQPLSSEELLKTLPGVVVAGDMGISNRLNVGIRGSYPRRSASILILEDGTPIAPATYLAPEAYYNPPTERLDGIQVIKGADILEFGGNTLHGVVNYVTRRPPVEPTLGIRLSGGSRGYHSQYLTYGGTWNNTGAEIQVLNKGFKGFQDNSGSNIFNSTFKVYSELGERQSIYLKINYHQENSLATYSGQTPFTFEASPTENPFDADELGTRRIAADLIHTYETNRGWVIHSKLFAHQFQRDWWRQNTSLIRAEDAADYLGEERLLDRYSYLDGREFDDEDYIRVGKISNGTENAKARNRVFKVAGIRESLEKEWNKGAWKGNLKLAMHFHREEFDNQEISNDSSRWARSGKIVLDEKYTLNTTSAFVSHALAYGKWTLNPMLRFDYISMTETDILARAQISSSTQNEEPDGRNRFAAIIPGVSVSFNAMDNEDHYFNVYTGVYKGYLPPTSGFGFLSIDEGNAVSTPAGEDADLSPQTSINFEIGARGNFFQNALNGQITYFNNNIRNFYSAGRREAFESLGEVNIQGLELSLNAILVGAGYGSRHKLSLTGNMTFYGSRILSGQIKDRDLPSIHHSTESRDELITKVNSHRDAFILENDNGELITGDISAEMLDDIASYTMIFGEEGLNDQRAPYVPLITFNSGLAWSHKGLSIQAQYTLTGAQYSEYLNFENESAEGAIGKLSAFSNLDASISYQFDFKNKKGIKQLSFSLAGKNLMNDIYRASRLHRLSSGIMPGGFIQVNGGISLNF